MLKTLLFTLIIVAISMAFFAIKILFKKNGRFPNTHVGHSAAMRNGVSRAYKPWMPWNGWKIHIESMNAVQENHK